MKSFISGTTFLAIVACLLWSTAFTGVKIGLEYASPLQFAGIRFFIAGLMILPFTGGLKNHFGLLKKHLRFILLIAFLNTFLQYTFFNTGMNMVPAALGAIIIGSGPLFVAMIAHFMMTDDKLSWKKLLIFLLGLSGIVLVSFGRNRFVEMNNVGILGIIILVIVNLISGFGNIFIARDKSRIPPLVLSSSTMIIGGGSLFLFSIPIEGFQFDLKPIVYYLALSWLSFLSAAAISIWYGLLKRPGVKVSDLNFWKFLIPVTGAMLAWIIIPGEKPSLVAIAGMSVTALSLVLLNIHRRRSMKKLIPINPIQVT